VGSVQTDEAQRINKVTCDGPDVLLGIFNNVDRVYNIGGDHLYVDELSGSMPCHVRLDGRDAPPVRLEEGMVLRRPFSRFILSFDYALFQDQPELPMRIPPTRVTLYVTFGPFIIEKPPKSYGVQPGFSAQFDCDADTLPKLFYEDMLDQFSVGLQNPFDLIGQGGCTVLLTNTDDLNTLYIKYTLEADGVGPAPAVNQRGWYPLLPGQIMSLILETPTRRVQSVPGFTGEYKSGLCVATVSGSCKYAWMISRSPFYGPPPSYQGSGV